MKKTVWLFVSILTVLAFSISFSSCDLTGGDPNPGGKTKDGIKDKEEEDEDPVGDPDPNVYDWKSFTIANFQTGGDVSATQNEGLDYLGGNGDEKGFIRFFFEGEPTNGLEVGDPFGTVNCGPTLKYPPKAGKNFYCDVRIEDIIAVVEDHGNNIYKYQWLYIRDYQYATKGKGLVKIDVYKQISASGSNYYKGGSKWDEAVTGFTVREMELRHQYGSLVSANPPDGYADNWYAWPDGAGDSDRIYGAKEGSLLRLKVKAHRDSSRADNGVLDIWGADNSKRYFVSLIPAPEKNKDGFLVLPEIKFKAGDVFVVDVPLDEVLPAIAKGPEFNVDRNGNYDFNYWHSIKLLEKN